MDTNFSININSIVLEPAEPDGIVGTKCVSINHPELKFVAVQSKDKTTFAGVATNNFFRSQMVPSCYMELLHRAYTNRTRERNYFRLYCQLLDNEISDDDFDAEIDSNPDKYVVKSPKQTSLNDICCAVQLCENMIGIETTDDFSSTFSIDDDSIGQYLKAISNE